MDWMNFDDYERDGRAAYAALATTIATILTAAIEAEEGYRLQQVKDRAKQPGSLRKKLEQRGIAATTTLEDEIKDLAGCRTVFYTNSDVTRFISSGIIHQNFEVLETKLHHPRREVEDAAELYISNHYLVSLKQERINLPEYSRFAGMRCEIQIQTILNHAWAEMAHDTIYKAPTLNNFGGKEFEGIKSRMQKVARKYLVPAGYEFQKIASDFQRLIDGKALFDGDALEAIVQAADNNIRAEALETFAENVLPFYDDVLEVYPDIVSQLLLAADRSKATQPVTIETPYGVLPAKTHRDILEAIAHILTRYRYLDIQLTFDGLCRLYSTAETDEERKPLLKLGEELAQHQMEVWKRYGPAAQLVLIDRIESLGKDSREVLKPLLIEMLDQILGVQISGTTSNFEGLILHRGTVIASGELCAIRTKAIELLKSFFALAGSEVERRTVLLALQTATHGPLGSGYTKELAEILLENTKTILEFQAAIATTLNYQLLQATEERVHRCFWMHAELPAYMANDVDLEAARVRAQTAALSFRDVANANPDFVIYKTLVGFNSVFPPAWNNKDFHYEEAEAYRAEQVDKLLQSVEEGSADVWFDRVCRYSQTESNDAATFPVFGKFLERMAESQPSIVLKFIDRLEGSLQNFLPGMLSGLMRSTERLAALSRINLWLAEGKYVGDIAWYLRFTDQFDEVLLRCTLDSAIAHNDLHALRNVLVAAVTQFPANPGKLIEDVFLPALSVLVVEGDFSWVRMPWFSWLGNPLIQALDEEQARIVLKGLVCYPELGYGAEYIAASIAKRWPANVAAFIGERQVFAQTDEAPPRYDAVPFSVYELRVPLAAAPEIMLDAAQAWFNRSPKHFPYDGGKLLASVFPDLSDGFEERLKALVTGGNEHDMAFVLGVLSAYEGRPCVYELVRAVIASLAPGSVLLRKARAVLQESGVVSGEFGFAELHVERKALLGSWMDDPSELVRSFAAEQIRIHDQRIAAENRSAEASIALRKLEWGEELDSDNVG
jgi:ppGpp synthetase/RelA/SpoT-type nucleotidyltranferase